MDVNQYMPPAVPAVTPPKPKRPILPILAVVLGVLLVISLVAFGWAFGQYRSYKDDVDPKIAAAVEEAKQAQKTELEEAFQLERDRLYNKYTTDPVIANVSIKYPRDWSFYLEQDSGKREQINAMFHPGVVAKADPTYGLRLQLVQRLYDEVVEDYQGKIEKGELAANPISSNDTTGLRLDGQIDKDHSGAVVILPIRDKTLVISTESRDFLRVFNDAIARLTFTP